MSSSLIQHHSELSQCRLYFITITAAVAVRSQQSVGDEPLQHICASHSIKLLLLIMSLLSLLLTLVEN